MKTDFLIIGCGFYGSVIAERIANELNKEVIIIDKRDHIGGNCYSEIDKITDVEYHKYGTHIFHTGNEKVWNYINNFTKFNNYRHQVLSSHNNKIYQLPINLETINNFFKKSFTPKQAEEFIKKETKKLKKNLTKNFENKAISQIGLKLYNAFIKNYTVKQWGKDPKNLPESIFNRLPIRFNYNEDYYHQSQHQGIPLNGYTEVFKKLLDHKKIKILLNKKYDLRNNFKVKYLTIYTGPLDKLFENKFGKLEWRSLRFEKKYLNVKDFQGSAVINYPDLNHKYTRIHEPQHLHPERPLTKKNKSLIIKEYPLLNNSEPYYPINDGLNREKHRKYKALSQKIKNFLIGGRLADYAYYDMDMTISAALKKYQLIKKIVN